MLSNKPKIAIIGLKGLPAFGGAARAWENIIVELNSDYDFSVYAIDSHTSMKGECEGFTQIVFKSVANKTINTFQYYIKSMFHCLFCRKYDLVIVNHVSSSFIIPFLRIKYSVLSRAGGLSHLDKKWSKTVRRIFEYMTSVFVKYSSEVVCVSKDQAKLLENIFSKHIYSIPNGVKLNEEIVLTKSYKRYIVFSAARIIEIKGLHVLLQALKHIDYTGKLIVIGSLGHDEKYAEYIKNLSKDIDVDYIGLIKDKKKMFKIIADAELFIFPSQTEAVSNMLLEVASLKTPIIASNINDNRSIFIDTEVLFFEVDNYKSLSEKINFAMSNREFMIEKSERAFVKIKNCYSIHSTANRYKDIINDLLMRNRKKI